MPPTPSGPSTSKGPKRVPGGNGERGAEREGFEDIARQRANLLPSSSNRNPAFVRTVIPVTGRLSRDEPGPDSPRPFWVEARFFAHCVDPDKAADLGIAARESLINAIRHGCGLDPGRRVQMELGMGEEGALVVRVCDEGPGFDPA